ncbi:MAG: response regulator [Lachnospirales bacterium]
MKKIVVVDDELLVIEAIGKIIKKTEEAYEVVGSANSGKEALDVIKEYKPDVVITDIRMPGITGLDLIKKVKLIDTNILFVIISAYEEFAYAKEAIELGVVDYISKPITVSKLKSALETCNKKYKNLQINTAENFVKILNKKAEEIVNCIDKEQLMLVPLISETADLISKYTTELNMYKSEVYKILCLCTSKYFEKYNINDCEKNFPSISNLDILSSVSEVNEYTLVYITRLAGKVQARINGITHIVIVNILNDINVNYAEDMGLNEYALKYSLNPNYLSSLFKEEVGETFTKYVTKIRIEKAKIMLKKGYKIGKVSTMVGYMNYRYFSEIFKREVGMSPKEYKGLKN